MERHGGGRGPTRCSPDPAPRRSPQVAALVVCLWTLLVLAARNASCVVVHQVRFIATPAGRTDYALTGESIELSCHYIMKDEAEDIKQLTWLKDGKSFLKWRKNRPGLEVLSHTFKGHIRADSSRSHLIIHNVTIDMHGKYKCAIKTDLGSHEMVQDVIVISQSNCKLNDWRVTSQPGQCSELFRLDCRNMFPRPVPSCGLWNARQNKVIRSVSLDFSDEPDKQTYRVSYSEKFDLRLPDGQVNARYADLLAYAGHLVFKCDISVPETSWRLSLVHKMFDFEDGCNQDPLETIERMRHNYSHYATSRLSPATGHAHEDYEMLASKLEYELAAPLDVAAAGAHNKVALNCWQRPRYGSIARLACVSKASHIKLVGANMLECRRSGWTPMIMEQAPKRKAASATQLPQPNAAARRPSRRIQAPDGGDTAAVAVTPQDEHRQVSPLPHNSLAPPDPEDPEDVSMSIPSDAALQSGRQSAAPGEESGEVSSNLTPAQLAALLPTCVSTRRSLATSNIVSSDRLPLKDLGHPLESTQSMPDRYRHASGKTRPASHRDQDSGLGYYLRGFSSSGAPAARGLSTWNVQVMVCFYLFIHLLFVGRLYSFNNNDNIPVSASS